ncbi:hypothetical protein NU195Hw_g3327t1 [Hortaea werneckii]
MFHVDASLRDQAARLSTVARVMFARYGQPQSPTTGVSKAQSTTAGASNAQSITAGLSNPRSTSAAGLSNPRSISAELNNPPAEDTAFTKGSMLAESSPIAPPPTQLMTRSSDHNSPLKRRSVNDTQPVAKRRRTPTPSAQSSKDSPSTPPQKESAEWQGAFAAASDNRPLPPQKESAEGQGALPEHGSSDDSLDVEPKGDLKGRARIHIERLYHKATR